MKSPPTSQTVVRLGLLCGTIYFAQGICEPTEGLIAQPMRSLLKSWKYSVEEIGDFAFWLGLPWAIKPLYGLLTDFVPLRGSRRRAYLILTSFLATYGLWHLVWFPTADGDLRSLLFWLLFPAIGLAFTDVVTDALMVESGKPLGLTGRLQSIQWTANYGATILVGLLGGLLSQAGQQRQGLTICAAAALCTLVCSAFFVREPPGTRPRHSFREALRELWGVATNRGVLVVSAFLFLWCFNPFCSTVLQLHMTGEMGLREDYYGLTVSISAAASLVAALVYGLYCRRVPFPILVHASIVFGILSTIGYWWLAGERSGVIISIATGFTYMSATMIQLDLAARICPLHVAGTVFAVLMSWSNLAMSGSTKVGSMLYDRIAARSTPTFSFQCLVAIGALFTAGCWLLVPSLRRVLADAERDTADELSRLKTEIAA